MGRVFVEEFAKRGLNVAVISNQKEQFEKQAKYLTDKYSSIQAKYIYADFTGWLKILGNIYIFE